MTVEQIVEQQRAPDEAEPTPPAPAQAGESLRFEDPAWDDEYCTWLDGGLRTCCG